MDEKLKSFAALLGQQQLERFTADYPELAKQSAHVDQHVTVKVRPGAKYTRVDVGTSGKYMVVNDTGEIFGIKAYGVIHRGHQYGTLDTISDWDWSGYTAIKRQMPPKSEAQKIEEFKSECAIAKILPGRYGGE